MNRSRDVAILIFADVEVPDFCDPFDVFSVAGGSQGASKPFMPSEPLPRLPISDRWGFNGTANRHRHNK